jgi:hypothetical protein
VPVFLYANPAYHPSNNEKVCGLRVCFSGSGSSFSLPIRLMQFFCQTISSITIPLFLLKVKGVALEILPSKNKLMVNLT